MTLIPRQKQIARLFPFQVLFNATLTCIMKKENPDKARDIRVRIESPEIECLNSRCILARVPKGERKQTSQSLRIPSRLWDRHDSRNCIELDRPRIRVYKQANGIYVMALTSCV